MKLLTEYLEHALTFERLAAAEQDPKLKAELEGQVKAYRKLAAERARNSYQPPEKAEAPASSPRLYRRDKRDAVA